MAGRLATGTTYVLDGSMHNDVYTNANLPLLTTHLLEFKVETGALSAQYGMHSAATVNAVTKSGSNDFHGGAFEFVRNYLFDARQLFASTPDTLKRNQFGGMLGGPILEDKLFIFAAYQQTDTRQSPNATVTYVPTAAEEEPETSARLLRRPARRRRAGFGGIRQGSNSILFEQPDSLIVWLSTPGPGDCLACFLVPQDQQCGRITYGAQVKGQ